jgi:hypothetical protein
MADYDPAVVGPYHDPAVSEQFASVVGSNNNI